LQTPLRRTTPLFADESPKNSSLVICGGWRIVHRRQPLQDMGMTNVAHIDGGYAEWFAGRPHRNADEQKARRRHFKLLDEFCIALGSSPGYMEAVMNLMQFCLIAGVGRQRGLTNACCEDALANGLIASARRAYALAGKLREERVAIEAHRKTFSQQDWLATPAAQIALLASLEIVQGAREAVAAAQVYAALGIAWRVGADRFKVDAAHQRLMPFLPAAIARPTVHAHATQRAPLLR
jgi:hypothetical protein